MFAVCLWNVDMYKLIFDHILNIIHHWFLYFRQQGEKWETPATFIVEMKDLWVLISDQFGPDYL